MIVKYLDKMKELKLLKVSSLRSVRFVARCFFPNSALLLGHGCSSSYFAITTPAGRQGR